MNTRKTPLIRPTLRGSVLALAALALSSMITQAVPYASGVTRSGNTVSFVLNQDAQGLVVLRDGANPVSPGTTAGVWSFDMTGFTSYQIIVTGNTAKAWTKFIPDATIRNFEYPFGVAINKNPASTNFGKIYISNARIGTTGAGRDCSDGIYMLRADGSDAGFATGGVDWTVAGASAPHKCTIGPDDHLYVADLSNDLAYEFNDDMSMATQLIDANNKTTGQYVNSIYVTGTKAAGNRKIHLLNGHYLDGRRGLITYDLGANATAIGLGTGTQVVGPGYYTYYPLDVTRDSSGFWYLNQYRATAGQAPAISKFDGSVIPNNSPVWATGTSYTYTWGVDLDENASRVAVGQDGGANNVYLFDMATGAFVESFTAGTGARPHELAYDAAGNIVTVDNIAEYARFWSPGGYTVAFTRSDGTFTLVTGGTVTVAAGDAQASETGPDSGTFTITRTQTGGDLTVYYAMTGTATSNVDYTISPPSPVTLPAGQATIDITVTPNDDSEREPSESAILTIQAHGADYSIGSAGSATVTIADNDAALRYWDGNGTDAGAGPAPDGTWGVSSFWSTSVDGTSATAGWTPWAMAAFSAGTDAYGPFTVTVNGTQSTDGPLFEEGNITLSGGALLLTNWSAVQVADYTTATINSIITGVSGMTKDLAGTLILGGANTYTGTTTIKAGTLKLGAPGVIPTGSGKGNVSVTGTLDLGGYDQTINGLSGAGTVDSSGYTGITNVLTLGNNNAATTFSGSINNSGGDRVGLIKIGTGTFTLRGTHGYSGDTTLSGGTVSVNASTFFGDETGALRFNGGSLMLTENHPGTTSFANPVVMTADTTLKCSTAASGTWYMRFSSEFLSFSGNTLTLTNQGAAGSVFDVQFQTVKGVTLPGPIVLNTGTRLELCNEDKINDTFVVGPVTGSGQVNYTSWNDATGGNTLAMNGNNTYSGGSFLTGGLIGFGANSAGAPGALTSGPIGTGSLTINNDGYLGMLAWGGPRTVGNAIVFNSLSEVNELHIDGTNDLTLMGTINLGVSNRTVRVANTGVTTFAGVISGGAAGKTLTKVGAGKLVFSGNNTYTIPTTVMEGALLVNNTAGNGTGTGAVNVSPGATLGGSGTIAGAVNASIATVAPGASVGKLTLKAGLDLTFGYNEWELGANSASNPGTDFDQIALTGGTLALGGTATLKIIFTNAASVPDLGNTFWEYPHQWKVIALSGTAANPGDANFGIIDGTNGISAGTFTTTADSTGVTLVYTPSVTPPAPTRVTSMTIGPVTGTSCTINYAGGTGSQFVLVRTNALVAPTTAHTGWERVATNSSGTGSFTIPVGSAPRAFYSILSE